MVTTASATNISPVIRLLWRCVGAFILFGQVATAAEVCHDYNACGSGAQHASSGVVDRHHGDRTEFCADEYVPASQVPATYSATPVPDLGPAITVVALWPPTPAVQLPQAQRDAEPSAHVPRFLTLRRLLR